MTVSELLAALDHLDVRLWVEGDRLHCSAPKGLLTAELQAALVEHKPALLALFRPADDGGPVLRRVPSASPEGHWPASFAQEAFWLLQQLAPGQSDYNIPVALELRGALAVGALERALGALQARHEAL